jgi:hypothetical protein
MARLQVADGDGIQIWRVAVANSGQGAVRTLGWWGEVVTTLTVKKYFRISEKNFDFYALGPNQGLGPMAVSCELCK